MAGPGCFLGGGALVSCSTTAPINHIVCFFLFCFFFFFRIPVVLENRKSSRGEGGGGGGGGGVTLYEMPGQMIKSPFCTFSR